jgi:hypothetical protein
MKMRIERRKERAMKIPNVNEVGEYGGEIRTIQESVWCIECRDNGSKEKLRGSPMVNEHNSSTSSRRVGLTS